MEILNGIHWEGLIIGISTFLIIGLFHPVVVKAEYYWGTRCWWIFLILGIIGIAGSLLISDILISSLLGVFSFSSFWSFKICEVKGHSVVLCTRADEARV